MIEIQNLHLTYPDGTHALQGLDLQVPEGQFLLICGANGSGKTTLLRLIAGLLRPTSGTISIDGKKDPYASREVRQLMGMVFQDPDSQIVGETVREDVAFGPENLHLSPAEMDRRVQWAMELMNLRSIAEKSCYLLSGGEKKRLAIAGVLAMKPRIFLLDEPFSNLDYPGVREVLGHMVHLHQNGYTLLIATHEVEKVIAHVDCVLIMHQGRIKASGPAEALLTRLPDFGVRPPCYALAGEAKRSWLRE